MEIDARRQITHHKIFDPEPLLSRPQENLQKKLKNLGCPFPPQVIMEFFSSNDQHDWSAAKTSRVVVPAVSIGSLAQLTVDVLVESLQMKRVGYLSHPAVLPLCGFDKESSQNLITSLEVFYCQSSNVYAIQQRAPVSSTARDTFRDDLLEWIASKGFMLTILLTGTDASQRVDAQLSNRFRYVATSLPENIQKSVTDSDWVEMEQREKSVTCPGGLVIPGGGMSRTYFLKAAEKQTPTFVAIGFVAGGDNREVAFQLVTTIDSLLHLSTEKVEWRAPESWQLLYGSRVPQELYW